jgi:hypothetical protein
MSAAFWWLIAFAATQLVIIAAGLIVPQASWISFRTHLPAPGTNSRVPSKSPTPQSA